MTHMPKYGAKRDKTEAEIVSALQQVGAHVMRLSAPSVPDLAVYFRSQWFMLDAKSKRGKLTDLQNWNETISPDAVQVVRSVEQALEAIGAL